jgi:16S rRNA G966 N2-methylase RsmD
VSLVASPLARLAEARQILAESRDLAEVKSIRDVAVAAKEYARAKQLGLDAQLYAQEIVNRATRRIGELLLVTPPKPAGRPKIPSAPEGISTPRQELGWKVSARSQKVAQLPEDIFEANVTKPLARLERIARDREAAQRRVQEARESAARSPVSATVDIRHGDFRDVLADLADVDAIITDPPYPAEYLPLLGDLAAWADKVLAPDGVLAVLIGQTHLPEVYRLLDGHRPYRWTACYLTMGAGYVSHARSVQCNWKPVLIYGGGPRFTDVLRSEGVDANAKSLHKWGQDYGAFHTLVERLTRPGQTVVDPFCGSGTTLLAAWSQGRHAIGADVDAAAIATARERLQ